MAYKLAVASSDGKVINQHFGRATQFLIFTVEEDEDGDKYEFLELVKTEPFCNHGEHNDNSLQSAAEGLVGCRAVLVSQIGDGAAGILKSKGIDSFEIHDFIENALETLIKYYTKINGGRKKND